MNCQIDHVHRYNMCLYLVAEYQYIGTSALLQALPVFQRQLQEKSGRDQYQKSCRDADHFIDMWS